MAKEKKIRKREKRSRKGRKHESIKPHKYYEVSETLVRNRNFCPRCGPGSWLSQQRGRLYCGKCGYTDFQKGRKESE